MARGINKVTLIGNLGKDPELKYMQNGDAVTTVTLATSDSWKDKSTGETKTKVEWHNIVFFRKLAEIVGEYTKKGSQVYVEGALRTRKYTDKNGADRYVTEIVAREMQLLGSKNGSTTQTVPTGSTTVGAAADHTMNVPMPDFDQYDDEIPF